LVLKYGAEAWTMTSEEMNVHRVFEWKILREICGLIKGESWRIRTNKEKQDILQGEGIVKFITLLRLRWYGHTGRMNNDRMPQKVVTTRMEETMERGRPWKRWTDEAEEDLKTVEIRNWRAVAPDQEE
jgi:hypothetical protein